jgi:acetyl esterase/lipase
MIERPVTEEGLVGDLFHDGSSQPRKAIVMLGGSEGGKIWSRQKLPARLLVERGFCVLSLAYFKAPGLPRSLEEIPLEYFEKALDWLAAQPEVVPDTYALIGGSKGAEAALLLGSRYPQVKAVAGFTPSSVVWQGIAHNRLALGQEAKSSWSVGGQGLPFVGVTFTRKDLWALLTLRLRRFSEEALQDTARVEAATIPVEKIQGAILLISGKRDQLWPSTYMCEQMVDRLAARRFPFACEHVAVDKGHWGLVRDRASWRAVFDFLQEHFA